MNVIEDDEKHEVAAAQRQLWESMLALRRFESARRGEFASNESGCVPEAPFCSFCGKGHNEVRRMIAGPGVYICNECITLCEELARI